MTQPPAPEMVWVEAPPGEKVRGDEVWDLEDDDEWLFEAVAKLDRRTKAYVEALKFNESDWVRNGGRFARYVGQGGGGRSGSGAASGEGEGVESAVGTVSPRMQQNAEDWFAERGLSRESMAAQARSMMSPQALEDGKVWYQEGHDYAAELGARHGISTDAAAGAVAALSPNTEWELNKRIAESLVRQTTAERFTLQQDEVDTRLAEIEKRGEMTPRRLEEHRQFLQRYVGSTRTSRIPTEDLAKLVGGPQVFANKEKAIRIVRGERPRTVLGDGSGSRTGMKVRSFYDNLTRPSASQEVTIDRRMIDAMLGSGSQVSEADRAAIFANPARYGVMRDAIRDATPAGLLPHQAQAAVWGAQGPVRARGKAVGETFIDEDTGTLRDWDAYAVEVAESMLLGGATPEEVDEMLLSQRRYLGVSRAATKAQTDALLYVLDLWSKETRKFNESDWVRNSGRFADYVGNGPDGGGGGAGAAADPKDKKLDSLKEDLAWAKANTAADDVVGQSRIQTMEAAIAKRREELAAKKPKKSDSSGTGYLDRNGIRPSSELMEAALASANENGNWGSREKATERLKGMLADAEVGMRMRSEVVERIIMSGGNNIRNTFELGASANDDGMGGYRAGIEQQGWSYARDASPADRPKYGYISPRGQDTPGTSQYGDVRLVFKPEVRERTTFFVGDSFHMDGEPERGVPSPLNKPDGLSWGVLEDRDYTLKEIADDYFYTEAQIHGPLTFNEVDRIEFRTPPSPDLQSALAGRGIRWTLQQ